MTDLWWSAQIFRTCESKRFVGGRARAEMVWERGMGRKRHASWPLFQWSRLWNEIRDKWHEERRAYAYFFFPSHFLTCVRRATSNK